MTLVTGVPGPREWNDALPNWRKLSRICLEVRATQSYVRVALSAPPNRSLCHPQSVSLSDQRSTISV